MNRTRRVRNNNDDDDMHYVQTRLDRAEQDRAYEESLRADQEKDRRRREERLARETEEMRQVSIRQQELERINQKRAYAFDKTPPEPEPTDANICHLQIKLGSRALKRMFHLHHTLKDVFHWVLSQPDSPIEFEIRSSFPKKTLYPSAEEDLSLGKAGLSGRHVLHVYNLDD